MEEVAHVFTITEKIKTRTKGQDKIGQKFYLSAGEAVAKFRNISWSPYDRADDDSLRRFACGISALPSRCCLLFSLNARVYFTFPLTKTYGYSRLCDRCNYMETAFFAIVCDCLRSAIVCDRLRLYGNQPLDRTWFYLLRSSAITIAGSQTIAEVFPYDRRQSQTLLRSAICDLRSAIIWKPALNFLFNTVIKISMR